MPGAHRRKTTERASGVGTVGQVGVLRPEDNGRLKEWRGISFFFGSCTFWKVLFS